jgi:tetratricopeptide (TPR) repeat protein
LFCLFALRAHCGRGRLRSLQPDILKDETNQILFRSSLRSAVDIALLFACGYLIWFSASTGFAKLLSTYASRTNLPAAAGAAVRMSHGDPDAHYICGAVLEANDDLANALSEYEQAVSLRPGDYVLWLGLAHARELNGDVSGATGAATEAVRLAPGYAQPHWQLGNLLVRSGRTDEGFAELRLAAASNSVLLPNTIDLAWQLSHGDTKYLRQAIQPNTPETYFAMADYLKQRGKASEAIALLNDAGSVADDYRRAYVDELIAAKRFSDAYALWSRMHPLHRPLYDLVDNGGFEEASDLDEPGFGWRAKKDPAVLLFLDTSNPREGRADLALDFRGASEPGLTLISQLTIVSPNHYQLHFSARSEDLVSGGLPIVMILDAVSQETLGQSGTLPTSSNGWRDYTIDFTIPQGTSAIQIALQRERCSKSPCPIFGRLWLDKFSLQKQ